MTGRIPDRVVIVSDYSAVRGGASKLAVLHAELLNAVGIKVTFLSGDRGGSLPDAIDLIALGGRSLLEQSRVSAAIGGLWNRKAQRRLAGWIRDNDTGATVYHLHGYHQTLSPSVLAALEPVCRRTVMHAHDYFLACPNGAFFDYRASQTCMRRSMSAQCILRNCDKRSFGQKLWRVARQSLQNRARARLLPGVTTVVLQQEMENWLFPEGSAGPVVTVPNPASPLLDYPVVSHRNRDFLYVGDIHTYKGVFLLAEAGRQAGASVRFVGDGQDRTRLEREFPEHRFDGWQDRPGLRRALADARMLVAPTLGPEPFGLAPVEALLSGVPVLISDSMLLARDIRDRGLGQSFAAGDRNSLAERLASLARDDEAIARMSNAAAEQAQDLSVSPAKWRNSLLQIYAGLMSETDRSPVLSRV